MKITDLFKRKRFVWISGVSALAATIFLFYVFDGPAYFIARAIESSIEKVERKYGVKIAYAKMRFSFPARLTIDALRITGVQNATDLKIRSVESDLRLSSLLTRTPTLKTLRVRGVGGVVAPPIESARDTHLRPNKFKSIEKLARRLNDVLEKIPHALQIDSAALVLVNADDSLRFGTNHIGWNDEILTGIIRINNFPIRISGKQDFSDKNFDLTLTAGQIGFWPLPFLEKKWGFRFGADKMRLKLNGVRPSADAVAFDGVFEAHRLTLSHKKIARRPLETRRFSVSGRFLFGENFAEWDSLGVVSLNGMKLKPYAYARFQAKDTLIRFHLDAPVASAQQYLEAVPAGVFTALTGLRLKGECGYRLRFAFDSNKPKESFLDARFLEKNLSIEKYGVANLAMMNDEFMYMPFFNARAFPVGPSRYGYVRADYVSPYLKKALLIAEDPSFFYHHGFIESAFADALIENIRKGRFRRGGSTISMQLVKNVFLTPEKTLARKLEELILVYLIESRRLVPKERMFEVYLNIIEWGPNIYGAAEAARFYFDVTPAQLSVAESIFLSFIVPRPRSFAYFFKGARLHPLTEGYFKLLGAKMLATGAITQAQYDALKVEDVVITGPARALLYGAGPIEAPTIDMQPVPDE